VSQVATHSRIKPVIRFSGCAADRTPKLCHIFFIERYIIDNERLPSYAFENRVLGPPRARFAAEITSIAASPSLHSNPEPRSGARDPTLLGMSSFFWGLEGRDFFNITQPDVRPARVVPRRGLLAPFRSPRVLSSRHRNDLQKEKVLPSNYFP